MFLVCSHILVNLSLNVLIKKVLTKKKCKGELSEGAFILCSFNQREMRCLSVGTKKIVRDNEVVVLREKPISAVFYIRGGPHVIRGNRQKLAIF